MLLLNISTHGACDGDGQTSVCLKTSQKPSAGLFWDSIRALCCSDSSGLNIDYENPVLRERAAARQKLGVLFCEDIVRDHGEIELIAAIGTAPRPAQS
jgi:hypothetical protein